MSPSERPTVFVVGSESLNNAYLGVRLELDGFKVSYHYIDFQDFVETPPEKLQDHICLIDYQCKKREVIFGGLTLLAQGNDTAPLRYALFNVCPDHICHEKMAELIRKGLVGLFFDGENLETICRGVRMILEGEVWLPRKLVSHFILGSIEAREPVGNQRTIGVLTVREKEVLAKIVSGLSNHEIADSLFISPSTVKVHTSRIYEKIGVTSRLQAALWMVKNAG